VNNDFIKLILQLKTILVRRIKFYVENVIDKFSI